MAHLKRPALSAQLLCQIRGICRNAVQTPTVGSTALGGGVAIPHARIAGIDRPIILFMRPTYAIDFAAPDGKPVTGILVILVPSEGDPEHHLQLLALISQKFSDAAFRTRLAEASSSDEVWKAFANWLRRMTKWIDD